MPSKKCLEHIEKRLAEKQNKKKKKVKKPLTEEQKFKKELRRREKISKTVRKKIADRIEKARRDGFRAYIKKRRAEIRERKRQEEKEKRRLKKEKEKLRNKKKPGPHKKPGPKPKRKKKVAPKPPKPRVTYNYKIVSCRNGKQNKFVGKYKTIEDAYEKFNELKENKVIFPRTTKNFGALENSLDEYLLIERSDSDNSVLRNEYGKLVEQTLNTEGWIVADKFRYYQEETFSIFGFDKRSERKTFQWIYDNMLYYGIDTKFDFKRVLVYKNKVIFKYDDDYMDIIICKCYSDAVRFYNMMQEWAKKDKSKQILFVGDYSELSERRTKLEEEIMRFTGWTKEKTQMNTTSFYRSQKKPI